MRKARDVSPDDWRTHFNLAFVLQTKKLTSEAIASYDAGLKIAPKHARLLTNQAIALRRLDRPNEALLGLAATAKGH